MRFNATLGAVLLTAVSAAAQDKVMVMTPQETSTVQFKKQLEATRVPLEAKIVKGAPYSAEVVTEMIQTLPDGNRIVQRTTGRLYRDSEGRTRREDDAQPGQVARIAITDPVAGTSYALDPTSHIALKTPGEVAVGIVRKASPVDPADVELKRKIEAELLLAQRDALAAGHVTVQHSTTVQHSLEHPASAVATGTRIGAPDQKIEKLPARNIEGVMAEGTRTTWTIPAGAIGNEQPIVTVTEQWRSPELQVLVMTRTSDPRTGESTYKLQNIVRGEQNRSWFEVPADYTVRETGIRKLAPSMK